MDEQSDSIDNISNEEDSLRNSSDDDGDDDDDDDNDYKRKRTDTSRNPTKRNRLTKQTKQRSSLISSKEKKITVSLSEAVSATETRVDELKRHTK